MSREAIRITREVAAVIDASVLAHPPERGGALLGPVGAPTTVTRFVFDPYATVTGVSYLPSCWLVAKVPTIEQQEGLEFRGILHSHPGRLDRPSAPDLEGFATGLRLNPHLGRFLGPIATRQPVVMPQPHEQPMAHGKISWYAAYRSTEARIELAPIPVLVMEERDLLSRQEVPMREDLHRLATAFSVSRPPECFITTIRGRDLPAGRIVLDGPVELLFIASGTYPETPPSLLVTAHEKTEQLQLHWDLTLPAQDRLTASLKEHFMGAGPYKKVFGPSSTLPLTQDPRRAEAAGWQAFFSRHSPQQQLQTLSTKLKARSTGLVSDDLSQRAVLIIGLGSVARG